MMGARVLLGVPMSEVAPKRPRLGSLINAACCSVVGSVDQGSEPLPPILYLTMDGLQIRAGFVDLGAFGVRSSNADEHTLEHIKYFGMKVHEKYMWRPAAARLLCPRTANLESKKKKRKRVHREGT